MAPSSSSASTLLHLPGPPPPRSVHCEAMAAVGNGAGGDTRVAFAQIYKTLKEELLKDPAFEFTDESHQWIDRMVDYNVMGGKCNRGLSVVDSYKQLKGADILGEEEMFLACTLGWCIEWLQAFFLVLDDIMDDSHTRRGQPCWFRVPQHLKIWLFISPATNWRAVDSWARCWICVARCVPPWILQCEHQAASRLRRRSRRRLRCTG